MTASAEEQRAVIRVTKRLAAHIIVEIETCFGVRDALPASVKATQLYDALGELAVAAEREQQQEAK